MTWRKAPVPDEASLRPCAVSACILLPYQQKAEVHPFPGFPPGNGAHPSGRQGGTSGDCRPRRHSPFLHKAEVLPFPGHPPGNGAPLSGRQEGTSGDCRPGGILHQAEVHPFPGHPPGNGAPLSGRQEGTSGDCRPRRHSPPSGSSPVFRASAREWRPSFRAARGNFRRLPPPAAFSIPT